MAGLPVKGKVYASLFASVTARTAGFNTVDTALMSEGGKLFNTILMFIGGSPGSTAGGIKTVTVWVLAMVVITGLRGRESVVFRGRSLSIRRCMNAVTLFLVVGTLFLAGAMLISLTHDVSFVQGAFETASALGTVGLTTGITPTLTRPVQALLAILMYTGRVGVLSFSIAFLNRKKDSLPIKYPEFPVMIG